MTSKKAAHDKRAVIPRASDRTRDFVKDWERHERAGQSDLARLKTVRMLLVSNEAPLQPGFKTTR